MSASATEYNPTGPASGSRDAIQTYKTAVAFHMDNFYRDYGRVSQAAGDLKRVQDELESLLLATGDREDAEVWGFCQGQLVVGWRDLVENSAFADSQWVDQVLAEQNPMQLRDAAMNSWGPILKLHYQLHRVLDVLVTTGLGLNSQVQAEEQQRRAAAEIDEMLGKWRLDGEELARSLIHDLENDAFVAQTKTDIWRMIDEQVMRDFDPELNFDTVTKSVTHLLGKKQVMQPRLVTITADNYEDYQFREHDISKTFMLLCHVGDPAALIQSLRKLTIDALTLQTCNAHENIFASLAFLGARQLRARSPIQAPERLGHEPSQLAVPAGFMSRAHLVLNLTDNGRLLDPRGSGAFRADWIRPSVREYPQAQAMIDGPSDALIERMLPTFNLYETEDGWWAVTIEGARRGTEAVFAGRSEEMVRSIATELCVRQAALVEMDQGEEGGGSSVSEPRVRGGDGVDEGVPGWFDGEFGGSGERHGGYCRGWPGEVVLKLARRLAPCSPFAIYIAIYRTIDRKHSPQVPTDFFACVVWLAGAYFPICSLALHFSHPQLEQMRRLSPIDRSIDGDSYGREKSVHYVSKPSDDKARLVGVTLCGDSHARGRWT
ncbi:hypothetical protein BC938DRAFT_471702 [Jimgerdemannia flammicorona]|uniref:Uncharacterized protein n=1 Tax=Jimgerdemannia flammicorona TaxID=994334 RepID=A0A433QUL8_9FUNG|nr:hypothetical protein BC938DRAFT_471702 [Jimgerdemannia flammicorona]